MDVFCELPCLTERPKVLNGMDLRRKWFKSADKRFMGQHLQKFISYNSNLFKFLGVQPHILGTDHNTSLSFSTSGFIGSIPLRASDTGKQIGDLVVVPRFVGRDRFEDYIEILNLLQSDIHPESIDSLPLVSGRNFRPPLYMEAVKFIASLEELIRHPWRKFDNIEKNSNHPHGQVNWNRYINNLGKIENHLKFPTRTNIMSELHEDYGKIRYVFNLCRNELLSVNTPHRIKASMRGRLMALEERLHLHPAVATTEIKTRFSDSPTVKNCKSHANKILEFNGTECTAWRVDFSDVFEKFVQYIFRAVAKEAGGKVYSNFRLHSHSSRYYPWTLKHVEPDAIYKRGESLIFIDAKYKSNLYNKASDSLSLKEEHRHDLHQVMAYASFSHSTHKYSFLCYPSEHIEIECLEYKNRLNQVTNSVFIMGIPLRKSSVIPTKKLLVSTFSELERK